MIELTTTAANYMAVPAKYKEDGAEGMLPHVEVILVYSEPTYRVDAGGGLVKERVTGQFRFSGSPKVLGLVADQLKDYASGAEEWFSKATESRSDKQKGAK